MKASLRSKLETLTRRMDELNAMLSSEDATRDLDRYRALTKEYSDLGTVVARYREFQLAEADLGAAQDMAADPAMKAYAEEEVGAARVRIADLEADLQKLLLPADPNDERNVFVEVRAGTGGDESALFGGSLFRMYTRFAERAGWQVEIVSESQGEMGGYKEVIARIIGRGAYSRLKFESGGHRVQRVPETEAQGRIHTSACTVAVMPEADPIADVSINPADLRIDTFRASGAGGQHINKTDSAIRITHAPSGIVVQCQNDRSQHRNRAEAMAMLKSRLYELELRKRQAEADKLEAGKTDVGWGHQIRSYVLDNSRIKDLRTNVEISATQKVLDGDLDQFIEASLKQGV